VPERFIKRRKFPVGAEVEARYKGLEDWVDGQITKDNKDDTYMVDYQDGSREKRVHKSLIRERGSGQEEQHLSEKSHKSK